MPLSANLLADEDSASARTWSIDDCLVEAGEHGPYQQRLMRTLGARSHVSYLFAFARANLIV